LSKNLKQLSELPNDNLQGGGYKMKIINSYLGTGWYIDSSSEPNNTILKAEETLAQAAELPGADLEKLLQTNPGLNPGWLTPGQVPAEHSGAIDVWGEVPLTTSKDLERQLSTLAIKSRLDSSKQTAAPLKAPGPDVPLPPPATLTQYAADKL